MLGFRQSLLRPTVVAWILDRITLGGDEEYLQPHVDAGLASGGGMDWAGTSVQEKLAYQPSASREMVTVLGVPSRGGPTHSDAANFDQTRKPLSNRAPLPYCL